MKEIFFILDNIRSRLNVGSIFRTADCAGVKKIFLCGITPLPLHPEVRKTALGAEESVAWKKSWELGVTLAELHAQGVGIIGAEKTSKSLDIRNFRCPEKVAIVLGPEVEGLHPKILRLCDEVVHIPMFGKKSSLNVSTAAAVFAYYLRLIKN